MAQLLVSYDAFLCQACETTKPIEEQCPDYVKWGIRMCHGCCDAVNLLLHPDEELLRDIALLEGQASFYRALYAETNEEAFYDCYNVAEEQLYLLRNGVYPAYLMETQ